MALLFLSPTAYGKESRSTVAVLDLAASNAPAGEAAVVSGFIRSAVVKADVYDVVDKGNMDLILAEQAFQQTGCTSQECAVKLGKILNVKNMIVGEYAVIDGVRFINASLVDVETGRIERTASEKDFAVPEIDAVAGRIASVLCGLSRGASPAPAKDDWTEGKWGIGGGFVFIPTIFKYRFKTPVTETETGPTFGGPVVHFSYRKVLPGRLKPGVGADIRAGLLLVGEGDTDFDDAGAKFLIKGDGFSQIYYADAVALVFLNFDRATRVFAGAGIGFFGFQEKSVEQIMPDGTSVALKGVGGVSALMPHFCTGLESPLGRSLVFELLVMFTTGEHKTEGSAYDFTYAAGSHIKGTISIRYDFE